MKYAQFVMGPAGCGKSLAWEFASVVPIHADNTGLPLRNLI